VKFLRYALDSWLPAFLDFQGMGKGEAAFYSSIFDFAGIGGAVLAGLLLDRVFRKDWAMVCLLMGIGCVGSYLLIIQIGGSPYMLAVLCGLVGIMLYGPDTLICGAAAVTVAGERNALAVAGIINGIGSIGPVVQEEVIGWLMKDASGLEEKRAALEAGMRNTNLLFLAMSAIFVAMMILQIVLQRRVYDRRPAAG
jgi:sugar phosphate permease